MTTRKHRTSSRRTRRIRGGGWFDFFNKPSNAPSAPIAVADAAANTAAAASNPAVPATQADAKPSFWDKIWGTKPAEQKPANQLGGGRRRRKTARRRS